MMIHTHTNSSYHPDVFVVVAEEKMTHKLSRWPVLLYFLLVLSCAEENKMSNETLDERYKAAVATQLTFNQATWNRLQELGVTTSTELELDFFYVAPSETEARALEQVLIRETDYKLTVEAGDGMSWTVAGTTQPNAVSLEILNQWVIWMITAGLHEDREFDGWGTSVPKN